MYTGYIRFADKEIGHRMRAYGYSRSVGIAFLQCADCNGMQDVLGDADYTAGNIVSAPWYDVDVEESGRFLGSFPLSIENIYGSTREGTVNEGILDGGVIQGTRAAVRRVRIRTLLLASGSDAMEYGAAWLSRSVMPPPDCDDYDSECGEGTLEYLSVCPPEYSPYSGPATSVRVNYLETPDLTGSAMPLGWTVDNGAPTADDAGLYIDLDSGLAQGTPVLYRDVPPDSQATEVWSGWFDVANVSDVEITLQAQISNGTTTPVVGEPFLLDPNGTARISAGGLVGESVAQLELAIGDTTPAGAQILVRRAILEKTAVAGEYFDGDTPDRGGSTTPDAWDVAGMGSPGDTVNFWDGTANDSTSTQTVLITPASGWTVEDYEDYVDSKRRYLYGVTTISGPLEEQRFRRRVICDGEERDVEAMIMEFTMASANPYVHGVRTTMDTADSVGHSETVQDQPFNLLPQPSMELSDPSRTSVVATNYAFNGSGEYGVTGWSRTSTSGSFIAPFQYTGIAGVGENSIRTQRASVSGTGTDTAVLSYLISTTAMPAGATPSFSAWMRVATSDSDTATITAASVSILWSGGTTTTVKTLTAAEIAQLNTGFNVSRQALAMPAGTTSATVRFSATFSMVSASNVTLALQADAVALTLP